MILRRALLTFRFLLLTLLLLLLTTLFSLLASRFGEDSAPALSNDQPIFSTVILDAGHGGEDGGAVSAAGDFEKDLNLSICKQMEVMLKSNGIKTVMTRTEDVLLYDKNADYHGRKKALDLLARRKIGEKYPEGVFVSIHMNAYPLSKYHGLQVWYSPNHSASFDLATGIQSTVASRLQPGNERQVKAAGSNIYLLHHLNTPALLVECGFLSNPEEAERLKNADYQKQLAFLITLSLLESNSAVEK